MSKVHIRIKTMPTHEFNRLRKGIELVEREFLDFSRRATGNYTKSELLRCRSYVTFCHAEIESYLEEICLKKLKSAKKKWDNRGSANAIMMSLVAYQAPDLAISDSIFDQNNKNTLSFAVESAVRNQEQVISKNHGIKSENFSRLFIPMGISENDVSEFLLNELDRLGRQRGSLVHKAERISLTKIRDPFGEEKNSVENVITELSVFDQTFSAV